MKRNLKTGHQNREGATESPVERSAPFPVPWGDLMHTLNEVAAQAWNDPAALAEQLGQQPGLTAYLAAGLNHLAQALLERERAAYLAANPDDVANGYAPPRTLYWRTTPLRIALPRTRGAFYPDSLPRYQRKLPNDHGQFLRDLLLHTQSFAELSRTVRRLGLPFSPDEIEPLLNELHDEARQFLERPLNTDYLAVFIDAKALRIRDQKGTLVRAHSFLALGITFDGRKELLAYKLFYRPETLESWKNLLLDLKNRGLTRVGLFITDDVAGLTRLLAGLFPKADHQLCTVHLLRNAKRHLSRPAYDRFRALWREVAAASSEALAHDKFSALLDELQPHAPHFIAHLRERREQYLAFTKYPPDIAPHIRSTNPVEGLNNTLETIQRNAGGSFHTEREATVKIWILADRLQRSRWLHPSGHLAAHLPEWIRYFQTQYEPELAPSNQTLNF